MSGGKDIVVECSASGGDEIVNSTASHKVIVNLWSKTSGEALKAPPGERYCVASDGSIWSVKDGYAKAYPVKGLESFEASVYLDSLRPNIALAHVLRGFAFEQITMCSAYCFVEGSMRSYPLDDMTLRAVRSRHILYTPAGLFIHSPKSNGLWRVGGKYNLHFKELGSASVSSVKEAQDRWVCQMNEAFPSYKIDFDYARFMSPIEETLAGKASVLDDILRRD